MHNVLANSEVIDGSRPTFPVTIPRLAGAKIDGLSLWLRSRALAPKLLLGAVIILNAILIVLVAQS
jgi:hypothetical protein